MITVFSDNKEIPVNKVEFSDGCINFKVNDLPSKPKYVSVNVDPSTKGYRVMEEIDLITDAILSNDDVDFSQTEFTLNLPYLYNARADRRFEKGNASPLSNFLVNLRDNIGCYDKINCCDIHNISAVDKVVNLNTDIIEKPQLQCFKNSLSHENKKDWDVVVAPDKGAVEKANTIASHLEVDILYANKVRDISTGKLTEMNIPDVDFTGKKILIPDDIFDYGGTLKWLGELLKGAGASKVDLYVTHLIAPKGLKHLTGVIDNVYCYQTVAGYINKQTVLDFNSGKL